MSVVAWVIGGRGLLGSALCRSLQSRGSVLFAPEERFRWDDPAALAGQLDAAVEGFAARAGAASGWEIHWAAGTGNMRSTPAELAVETDALARLLALLGAQGVLRETPGAFALASSAGSIYAGSTDFVVSERSAPAPTTAYAHEKLVQEARLQAFADGMPALATLAARLSTLYGRQAPGKKQGLLSYVARCVVRGQPIHVYVPLDTMRDYIAAEDAADAMVDALRRPGLRRGSATRIIASESSSTISEILSIFRRVSRRSPRIITSVNAATGIYSPLIQFRSVADKALGTRARPLHLGIAQVLEGERQRYVLGGDPG